MGRSVLLAGWIGTTLFAGGTAGLAGESTKAEGQKSAAIFVNLGNYAKGDGTDETEAIQKAFDALIAPPEGWQPHLHGYPHRLKRGVLYIPTPPKYYGISRTINVYEKWNALIEAETPVFPGMGLPPYFVWLGPDGGTMFRFNYCGGLRVENLSLSGNGKKVTGVLLGQENTQPGFFKFSSFSHLSITDVGIGMKLGDYPNNGPDIAMNSYRDVFIHEFSEHGLMARSGNLADNTFLNLSLHPAVGAKDGVVVQGGQLVILNSCLGGGPVPVQGAAVAVYAGGINIYGSWSEWRGPLLYGHPQEPMPGNAKSDSNARYSTFLVGVQHYPGGETQFWRQPEGGEKPESENPVPVSIDWDFCEPLTLINCSFWGGVRLGPHSGSSIIDLGTTFSNRDSRRFYGEGIERYGRLVQLGTVHPDNVRVVEPYLVDRRNMPGTGPPKTGVWQKGDCIRNIDPDPTVPAKAWAGWICIEAGEPGRWAPFGRIEQPEGAS